MSSLPPASFISLFSPFDGLGSLFQPPQPRTPISFDEIDEFIESFRSHDVEPLRSDAALVEQPRSAQHTDMLGDSGPGQLEPLGNLSSRHFPLPHELDDLEAGLVAQSLDLD